jgi:hypothetical protein
MPEPEGASLFDVVSAVLALLAAGELVAARFVAGQDKPRSQFIATLLFWEGIALLGCAAVLYIRQDFDVATIVSLVALWLAGAAVGLLRGGVFDRTDK